MSSSSPPRTLRAFLSIVLMLVVVSQSTRGQDKHTPAEESLRDTIAALDAAVFAAFNAGDLEAHLPYFHPSLEFYHDQGGVSDYGAFVATAKTLFARDDRPVRTLVPGSLDVYPIPGYGAIQAGLHRFCLPGAGVEDCGTFKFVHIWKKDGDQWRITRVISYDH